MKCYKCGKEMDRADRTLSMYGVVINLSLDITDKTKENTDYFNAQLGKYSNGQGECHVAICYECYIDGLFGLPLKVKFGANPVILRKNNAIGTAGFYGCCPHGSTL